MTRVAVVSYALDATQAEKIAALERGIREVIGELIVEHGQDPDDVFGRCEQAIDDAVDDRDTDL
jgi:hypothetical protein